MERRKNVKRGRGENRIEGEHKGIRLQFPARCDKTRENSFFFPNEKEVVQKEEEGGRKRGGGKGCVEG